MAPGRSRAGTRPESHFVSRGVRHEPGLGPPAAPAETLVTVIGKFTVIDKHAAMASLSLQVTVTVLGEPVPVPGPWPAGARQWDNFLSGSG